MARRLWILAALTLLAAAPTHATAAAPPEDPLAVKHYGSWGVDTTGMDRSIRPGDDFAMYAFGKWYREATIPPGAPAAWNRMDMRRRNEARIRWTIEDAARNPDTANRRLIGDLYASYMDADRIERLDGRPLQPTLAAIRSLPDKDAVARMMGRTPSSLTVPNALGLSFFDVSIAPWVKDPSQYILRLHQGGLGAGERDLYLDDRLKASKAAYEKHAARMLGMAGWSEPDRYAREIVEMETRIAQASWSPTESDDISRIYNLTTVPELEASAPGFPWRAYLDGMGAGDVRHLIVLQKSAFPKIAAVFAAARLDTLKAWLAFHSTDRASPYLSGRFQRAHFEFWGKLRDQTALPPREESVGEVISVNLTHPLAREYMAKFFSPETKAQIEQMAVNIKAAMGERIRRLDWMGPQTKAEALAKLSALRLGIGYPERWRDYSGLRLRPDDLFGNIQRATAFNWAWQVGKLGRPVDRDEWLLEPYALGAQASYARSYLTFSTGFLQPPYFDPDADPAVNYAAIGATIGHEIGHIFDAGGAQVDSRGVLRDWWAPEDAARFQAMVAKFEARLNSYEEAPGQPVNGKAGLREQMAHLYGLEAALDAYHATLGGKPAPVIDGFTGDQRFFLGFAQIWQGKATDWFRRMNYEHPPLLVIINDVMRNMDEWYVAFDVKPGDRLYLPPEERSRIW